MIDTDSATAGEKAARESARRLMSEPKLAVAYEPTGPLECHAAVNELAAAFSAGGETFREMVDNSRGGAESLSTDSFQGLSEIVQNADDEGATSVSFVLSGNRLEVQHNGRPVDLRDLRAMSVPWLTTKAEISGATGRFGVGLSTLHAVAETFEVHSGNYHVRIGDPFLTNLGEDPRDAEHSADTVLRVVFRQDAVTEEAFVRWFDRWDHSALIFLTSVREISFATTTVERQLRLKTRPTTQFDWTPADTQSLVDVTVSNVRAPDGRRWLLATCEALSPKGIERTRKKKGKTTPLAVALPLFGKAGCDGQIYAGLPVVRLPGIPVLLNAQFDPVTARQGFLGTAWNFALASLIEDLWGEVITYLFQHQPRKAWRCVPTSPTDASPRRGDAESSDLVARLAARIRGRSDGLASTLALKVDGAFVPLMRLAVEEQALTGLLNDAEVIDLAGADQRLPDAARDKRGRWREVLRHWRGHTVALPKEVTVRDALRLLDQPRRSAADVVRLTSVALDSRLGDELRDLACVLDDTGQAHVPPSVHSPYVLTESSVGLAADLGLGLALHPEYLRGDGDAVNVRQWLSSVGALIAVESDTDMLERLALAGATDNPVELPLTDVQLRRLRLALEPLETAEVQRLGRGIGRAVFIRGYVFASDGTTVERPVRPCDAYFPKRIDTVKDGFFTAAASTPGLVWVANQYADVLKSDLPRGAGLGAQRFLRALGVATMARIEKHPGLERKYQGSRKRGLWIRYWDGTPEWRKALVDLDADFTLEDWDSPDLIRVLHSIAAEPNGRRRRERANAMLETLGRSWRDLNDHLEVEAAYAMNRWNVRGKIRAFWLWRASSVAWLDNAEGVPTAPLDLRRRSTANLAVFGDTPDKFLHPQVTQSRSDVLNFLGVSREPSTSDLIRRLRTLTETDSETTYAECATIYVALAARASDETIDRTPKQLREQLAERGGLIRTARRWVSPNAILHGPAIFGERRDFTPSIPETKALWRFLRIPEPRLDDCLSVLGEIAKSSPPISGEDEATVLQTLRLLDTLLHPRRTGQPLQRHQVSNRVKTRLSSLRLWTSQGWTNKRPIYVTQDPQVTDGIGDTLAIWTPGADPAQFQRLFPLLKLTPITADDVVIDNPDQAYPDSDATARFQRALGHFKADLARNSPEVERSLMVAWTNLEAMEVRIHPLLEATVTPAGAKPIAVAMHAKFAPTNGALFLRNEDEIDRVDGVGRALATLFSADERTLAYTWLAAVQKEREGARLRALELATERSARETRDIEEQMASLRALQTSATEAAAKKPASRAKRTRPAGDEGTVATTAPDEASPPPRRPRVLVDIDSLVVTNAGGEIVNEVSQSSATKGRTGGASGQGNSKPTFPEEGSGSGAPTEPDKTKAPPQQSPHYREYSDTAKERLGLKIVSRVLAGDAEALIDIRNQRNVGADAIDDLGKYYELKVFAKDEGDTVTLEPSQIARAMTEPKFFLVIVSNLEGEHARPKVRVIVDPLRQLSMAKESKVKFSGLQEARGLVFTLDNVNDENLYGKAGDE